MPTWMAPKLPPPASTNAVRGPFCCSDVGKAAIAPKDGATDRAPPEELIAAVE